MPIRKPVSHLLFLVFSADFFDAGEYVTTIKANGKEVNANCNPKLDCVHYYHTCIDAMDVTAHIDSFQNLTIAAFATDEVNTCPFKVCQFSKDLCTLLICHMKSS